MSSPKIQAEVVEDPETKEYLLSFPPELITQLDWQENDTLTWTSEDSNIVLTNITANARKAAISK